MRLGSYSFKPLCCLILLLVYNKVMITFDSLTLKAFIEENKDFFIGARIQKIQQPTRREIILNLRNNGENRKFYININPQFYHLCFINKETEVKRFL